MGDAVRGPSFNVMGNASAFGASSSSSAAGGREDGGRASAALVMAAMLLPHELKSLRYVARNRGENVMPRDNFLRRLGKVLPTELKLRLFGAFKRSLGKPGPSSPSSPSMSEDDVQMPNVLSFNELLGGVTSCCKTDRLSRMLFFVRLFMGNPAAVTITRAEAIFMLCGMLVTASPVAAALVANPLKDEDYDENPESEWMHVSKDDESPRTSFSAVDPPLPVWDLDAVYTANKSLVDAVLWQFLADDASTEDPNVAAVASWLSQRLPRLFEAIEDTVHKTFLGATSVAKPAPTPAAPAPTTGPSPVPRNRSKSPPAEEVPSILLAQSEPTSATAAAALLIAQAEAAAQAQSQATLALDSAVLANNSIGYKAPRFEGAVEGCILNESWAWLVSCGITDGKYARDEPWKLLYNSTQRGFSLTSFRRHVGDYPGASLLVVRDAKGSISAAFVPEAWRPSKAFRRHDETVLFELVPKFDACPTLQTGDRNHVYYNDNGTRTNPDGIGFGGKIGQFRMFIDGSLQNGYRHCGTDTSFIFSVVPGYCEPSASKTTFSISRIEVWGLGGKRAEKYQQGQKKWEDRQVEKARAGPRSEWAIERQLLDLAGRTSYVVPD